METLDEMSPLWLFTAAGALCANVELSMRVFFLCSMVLSQSV